MENQNQTASEVGAKPKELSLEDRLERAELSVSVLKDMLRDQGIHIQNQESQIEQLKQEITYLRSGDAAYKDKTWLEKIVHCIEDVEDEPMNATQILRHLEQRDKDHKLADWNDPRKTLSVILSRGVKNGRLYAYHMTGISGRVYGVS